MAKRPRGQSTSEKSGTSTSASGALLASTTVQWPADKTERWPIEKLIPFTRNSKLHPPEQIDQIAASIQEWGWTIPVLVDESGVLIAGHARILAARQLGIASIPTMVARGWSEAQKRAYVIADNKLTENGGWDDKMLRLELTELKALEFDLSLTGFPAMELVSFITNPNVGTPVTLASLTERFGVVPFSVLNAREGIWQNRKRAWVALGIKSEVGRGENLLEFSDSVRLDGGAMKARQAARKGSKASKPSAGWPPMPAND